MSRLHPPLMSDFVTSCDFHLTLLMVPKIISILTFPPSVTLQMLARLSHLHLPQEPQALYVKIRTRTFLSELVPSLLLAMSVLLPPGARPSEVDI